MASNSLAWLDPKAIDSAKALEWIAKMLSKGRLQGKHKSNRLGNGYEFSQYRSYVQGDDLRLIDWKMYGKTDKYYIKQSEVERDHNLHIIMDNSKSMDYKEDDWSKLLYSKLITACLSYMNVQQGDTFSWSSNDQHFGKVSSMQQWKNCVSQLLEFKSASDKDEINLPAQRNRTYLWLTDLYQPLAKIESTLSSLKNHQSEFVLFHLIGEKEENLDFQENSIFIDLESGNKIQLSPKAYRAAYSKKLNQHIRDCKDLCFSKGVYYKKMIINHPVDLALQQFLDHYQSLDI